MRLPLFAYRIKGSSLRRHCKDNLQVSDIGLFLGKLINIKADGRILAEDATVMPEATAEIRSRVCPDRFDSFSVFKLSLGMSYE